VKDVLVEAGRLAEAGQPFVLATVVGVERPSSARVGDRALVTADGELRGWVGGACTEPEVVRLALAALSSSDPRRERIESRCASEGAVEVLIEPQLPAFRLAVIGEAPAARVLRELAAVLGWRTTQSAEAADAVVIASMGRDDEAALEAALTGAAAYVGLVASAKRAAALAADLRDRGVDEEALARIRSPAGLDLGPSSQEEIAVAILAEVVAWRHTRGPSPADLVDEAIDPICSMTVGVATAKETATRDGVTYYFCSTRCREKFEAAQVAWEGMVARTEPGPATRAPF
jgi:xanthine dehydrogenase accessory factor